MKSYPQSGIYQKLNIILEHAYSCVAVTTKQAANTLHAGFSGWTASMVMVYRPSFNSACCGSPWICFTTYTTFLFLCIVPFERYAFSFYTGNKISFIGFFRVLFGGNLSQCFEVLSIFLCFLGGAFSTWWLKSWFTFPLVWLCAIRADYCYN